MTICTDYLPDRASLVDKAIFVSILLQVKCIKIDDVKDDLDIDFDGWECDTPSWSFDIDEHGWMTRVRIGDDVEDDDLEPYNLPAAIARLDRLTELTVFRCLSLPAKELL